MGLGPFLVVASLLPPPPPPPTCPFLAASWAWRDLIWLASWELEVVREELVVTSCSRTALSLVAALARLSRALSMEPRKLAAWLA